MAGDLCVDPSNTAGKPTTVGSQPHFSALHICCHIIAFTILTQGHNSKTIKAKRMLAVYAQKACSQHSSRLLKQ